jgi:hypothetical protein
MTFAAGTQLTARLRLVGLKNVGNTCYFNALLQTYFSIPNLRELILSLEVPSDLSHIAADAQPTLHCTYFAPLLFFFFGSCAVYPPVNSFSFLTPCSCEGAAEAVCHAIAWQPEVHRSFGAAEEAH